MTQADCRARCLYSESYSLSYIVHSNCTFVVNEPFILFCYDFIKSLSVLYSIIKHIIISRDMQDNYSHVCVLLSTVFLLFFVVDCGLVTRNRESSYRPSEFLMQLRDKHNAGPLYRWREWERSTGCLIYSRRPLQPVCFSANLLSKQHSLFFLES